MPLTILIVDDDIGIRTSIGDYLEMAGYSVISAANGQEALPLVDQYQPQLIVTDVIMPQMDGYDLVQRVRKRPAFRLLPVIFLSARNKMEERIRGYQVGADLYMPKPFELEELGVVVRHFLDRYALMLRPSFIREWRSYEPSGSPVGMSPSGDGTTDPTFGFGYQSHSTQIELKRREQEVLDLLTQGLSNVQIGDRLYLSHRTIEKYVSCLLKKTETCNRAELVRFALEHHLVK
ncbi:MAG: DNA-binding response regulator [Geitlerinemataceae cyanobacterium]